MVSRFLLIFFFQVKLQRPFYTFSIIPLPLCPIKIKTETLNYINVVSSNLS